MKNLLVLLFMATLFVGCTDKKQKEEAVEETAVEVVDSLAVEVDSTTLEANFDDDSIEQESSEETTQE